MRAGHQDVKHAQRSLIRELSRPDFRRWGAAAASEWMLIAVLYTVAIKLNHLAVWFLVTVIVGSRQHALGVLGHDAAHFTAARNRTLNDLAGELLCFWPLFTGLHDFRAFHLAHHRHFNTDKDPELLFKNKWSKSQWSLPKTRPQILALFVGDLVGLSIIEVVKAFYLLGKTRPRSVIGPVVWWLSAGSALWSVGCQLVIVSWIAALLTSFWAFFRLRTWTEHVGSESSHIVYLNWWQKFFITPHCSWSHDEHHDYPSVPFWQRHRLRPKAAEATPFFEFLASFENYSSPHQEIPTQPDPISNIRGIK